VAARSTDTQPMLLRAPSLGIKPSHLPPDFYDQRMAKWLGAPTAGGVTSATRAKDSDRQEICKLLDDALADGELTMEEHRDRISSATHALTLGDLHALVVDLQRGTGPARLPAVKAGPRIPGFGLLAAAFVVSVLLGVGIGWGLFADKPSMGFLSNNSANAADPGAKPDGIAPVVLTPPTQLQSLGGLTGLLDQTRKKFGDVLGYRLVVYPNYAVLDRADPRDARRSLSYTYRGGWDDPSSSPKSSANGATPVDLSKFDITAVVGIMRGAPDSVHIKQQDVKTTYLIIEPGRDPTLPGALSLSVHVSSDYGSGSITFAGDGSIKRISPPS
jgi:Domain of unknown function (DUF1707)